MARRRTRNTLGPSGSALPCALFACAALACASTFGEAPAADHHPDGPGVGGIVFEDRNSDGVHNAAEPGIRGVAVSNGLDVVRTDSDGRYRIPLRDDAAIFVIQPRGYRAPVGADGLPRFYRLNKPLGSQDGLEFAGVPATGPPPTRIDFALQQTSPSERFRMLLFGDTQPYSLEEIGFLSRDIIEPLIGADVAFGLTLGDLVGDDLSLFEPLNAAIAQIGVPWYNVLGNHDLNFDASGDAESDASFERVYGPSTYAFQVGRTHFFVIDDVIYQGWDDARNRRGRYEPGFSGEQIAFIRNYLATVPSDDLLVFAMHIPLQRVARGDPGLRDAFFEAIAGHPHTVSFSSHTHVQYHYFFGEKDGLEPGRIHHHINQGAAAGSWWFGGLDEIGVPHATMRDGTPNGYSIVSFDGSEYRVEYRVTRRPADYQMNVIAPDSVSSAAAADTEVVVNVFAGSERSNVEMRLGKTGAWQTMTRDVRPDPLYLATLEREGETTVRRGHSLPPVEASRHIWVGRLPANPEPGTRVIEVRTRDVFGNTYSARRIIRID